MKFYLARHFGFCFGVENAIEISYKAVEENPERRVYLLSQMIHNQLVNEDLQTKGIKFIMDTDGTQFVEWDELKSDDIVIIPAFGTTREIEKILEEKGIEVHAYNTTCPFVEKVWNRATKLGTENYTVIIHGKYNHEETRATFSHSRHNSPSVIVRDMEEAKKIGDVILGKMSREEFHTLFQGKYSKGFDPDLHLQRVGVVNQTTMLATETQAIADFIKQTMMEKYGDENYQDHFADTRDTLCYATNDNQEATNGLLQQRADLAIVVGGYNSSNTSHIVELCEQKFPTYFINSSEEIKSASEIHHFDCEKKQKVVTQNFLPNKQPVQIILTSGASCPDTLVDQVMLKILDFYKGVKPVEELLKEFEPIGAK